MNVDARVGSDGFEFDSSSSSSVGILVEHYISFVFDVTTVTVLLPEREQEEFITRYIMISEKRLESYRRGWTVIVGDGGTGVVDNVV